MQRLGSWLDRFRVLHLRRLRERPLRLLLSILGMASGVALVVTTVGLSTSISATARSTADLMGDHALVVASPAGVHPSLVADLRATAGVLAVRGWLEAPVLMDGEYGWMVAQEPGPAAPRLDGQRRALVGVRTPVAGRALDPRLPIRLTVASGRTFTVEPSGRAPAVIAGRYGGRFLAVDLETALAWNGLRTAPAVLVSGTVERSTIERVVGDRASVSSADDRVAQARVALQPVTAALGLIGAISLAVGGFLLFNTMNMSALERRHELAAIRALGSSRRSLLGLVVAEAAALGVAAALLGAALGIVMISGVVAAIPEAFNRSMGTPLEVSAPWWLVAIAVVAGVVVAILAAIVPARRTMRVDPVEALRRDVDLAGDVHVRTRWGWIGAGAALLVLARLLTRPDIRYEGPTLLFLVGIMIASNGMIPLLTGVVARVCAGFGAAGRLGALALTRAPRRVWATLMSVTVSVAMLTTMAGVVVNLRNTMATDLRTGLRSSFWLGVTAGETVPFAGLPRVWERQIAKIPGVASVPSSYWQFVQDGGRQVLLGAVRGNTSYTFFALAPPQARAAMLRGEGAFILKSTAVQRRLDVGDTIALPGASPPVRLPILAVVDGAGVAGGGMILFNDDLFAKHYGVVEKSSYEVVLRPGADSKAVERELRAITATAPFPVRVMTGEEYVGAAIKSGDSVIAVLVMAFVVIVACAGVAMLNTMTSTVLDRRRELAVLRAVGATSRQVGRSLHAEALSIGLVGGTMALAIGLERHQQTVHALSRNFPLHLRYQFVPATVALALLTSALIAVVGSALPSRRATRADLLRALADE